VQHFVKKAEARSGFFQSFVSTRRIALEKVIKASFIKKTFCFYKMGKAKVIKCLY
jgi:hypothetical protein